jgi:hypothetical protein
LIGENQPGLFAAADALCWKSVAVEDWTADRGHGRIDVRTIKTMPATARIAALFPHVRQVFLVERYTYGLDRSLLGAVAVLGITSLPPDQAGPGDLLAYLRGHWAIEMHHYLYSLGVQNGHSVRPCGTCRSEWGKFIADDGQGCCACCRSAAAGL